MQACRATVQIAHCSAPAGRSRARRQPVAMAAAAERLGAPLGGKISLALPPPHHWQPTWRQQQPQQQLQHRWRRQQQQQQGGQQRQQQQRQRLRPQAAALPEALAVLEAAPVRDAAAVTVAVAGSLLLVKFCDTLERFDVVDKKLSRKLVHTLAGPGFMLTWPLFSAEPYTRFVAAAVPALNILRLLLIGSGVVKDERTVSAMSRTGDPAELLRGPLYYVIVLLAVTSLYWRDSPVGLIVTALMCGGDGLADIVGRRLGASNPLPWNPNKSWAGSAAMFAGGLGMSLALISFFSSMGYFECDLPSMVLTVAGISLAAAVVESLPVNQTLDDNLSVPGVAAALGILFLQVAVVWL